MTATQTLHAHRPRGDEPDAPPGGLPVEPDDGPVPPLIPDDPEAERTVVPAD